MHARTRLELARSKRFDPWRPASRARRGTFAAYLAVWVETCVDYYRAAVLYEELRHLSDAQLKRRRLSRATLARDIARACDRANR